MKWISIREALPQLPEDRVGVAILVAEFDPCFDDCSPGRGYTVRCKNYGTVNDRDGKRLPNFERCETDLDFMELEDFGEGLQWYPLMENITHWMYLPDPPGYNGADLNPLFKWYHENAYPTPPLKVIGESEDTLER